MADTNTVKAEAMPDLDDLLQCPVCYEIPANQIFQCNEGHHVCGRCKSRLELCPVCRSMFFGTRNYAMEELIANVRKHKAFKLGGKMTVASSEAATATAVAPIPTSETKNNNALASAIPPVTEIITLTENTVSMDPFAVVDSTQIVDRRPPLPCKGLFRCLCCKEGQAERLPLGRLLNHLRYYHQQSLIEGKSEAGIYSQSWQINRDTKKSVTAVRVRDMGVFFLVVELTQETIHAWVAMAASTFVAHEFRYVITMSARDREAFFTDCVWSVRACEGTLKKRNRCLLVSGLDVQAMRTQTDINVRLQLRRTASGSANAPRGMLRVANRGRGGAPRVIEQPPATNGFTLEPLIQGLHDDVERLTRAFNTLRSANLNEGAGDQEQPVAEDPPALDQQLLEQLTIEVPGEGGLPFSRSARRRMQTRMRRVLTAAAQESSPAVTNARPAAINARPAAPAPARSRHAQSRPEEDRHRERVLRHIR